MIREEDEWKVPRACPSDLESKVCQLVEDEVLRNVLEMFEEQK